MRRSKVESFDDMARAPKGVWFEMPDGIDIEEFDATTKPPTRRLHLRLPPHVARDFSTKPGERLTARIKGGTLTLEKSGRPREPRKPSR